MGRLYSCLKEWEGRHDRARVAAGVGALDMARDLESR